MTRDVQHIEEFLDKGSFPVPNVEPGTRFSQGTLVVYWMPESPDTEYTITIEDYFKIASTRKVTFKDFK